MSLSPSELVGMALLGGVLAFEQNATPSLLLSQPMFSGALCGAVLGRFESGVVAGALMQMIYAAVLPVGGALLPDAMLAGLAAAACAPPDVRLAGAAWLDDGRLAVPAVLGVMAAYFGRAALHAQRRLQARLAAELPRDVDSGAWRRVERLHTTGAWLHAGRGALCAVVVVIAAPALGHGLEQAGIQAPAGRFALALAGLALMRAAGGRRRLWLIGVGAALGAAVVLL